MNKKFFPPYRILDPIGFYISWAFVFFNAILGIYMWLNRSIAAPLFFIRFDFWAFVFILLAIYLFVALIKNSYSHIRLAMLLALVVKAFWTYALIVLANRSGFARNLYLLDMWLMITTAQALVVIFYPPRIKYGPDNK